jgi:hypothetical protein
VEEHSIHVFVVAVVMVARFSTFLGRRMVMIVEEEEAYHVHTKTHQ